MIVRVGPAGRRVRGGGIETRLSCLRHGCETPMMDDGWVRF
jgi:hypothetical protein